ncbi:MAG: hypothetical protein DCC71_26035 [Proteobacteria bacterium]|nr:MAG: hypothetical protein DCC71_26035 [Pseudomonadota bacterium]
MPRPAFGGAFRRGALWNGAVATHCEVGAFDAERFLHGAPDAERLARALAAAARAVRRFHDAGGWHPDLHVKNLLVREVGQRCEALVIDLDGARVVPAVAAGERMAQLMRLYRSLRKRGLLAAVGDAGADRFFREYAGDDRALAQRMLDRLPAERRRIALHALLYRKS